ncbi:hypothetical protein SBF1_4320001 [Candidatus Desulfosporosinus infrequens]|uniref:Uncharacterized protein n=1 Tax=Candidatus Desulfosporosinus infrequens TaxID=2043169 RepID=A0A2U3LB45_9FIRM|nr:hypothetical protein SBF1_4320001 [Candidatus Desulfosporosinus infrequens]
MVNIGNRAFGYCSGLTNIRIPPGVTGIGDEAFSGCYGLTSISIPPGVTDISDRAFMGCFGLTNISIPPGVINIGDSAFSGCSRLTSISIPPEVTNIGDRAFECCVGLTSISIPPGVTNIGEGAFEYSGLTTIIFNSATTMINDKSDNLDTSQAVIPAATKIIGYDPSIAKDYATKHGNTFKVIGILQSISIATPASKLNYTVGDTLDITGLVITGTYSDNSIQPLSITASNITGFNSAVLAKDQVLTITVGAKTTTYKVEILADRLYGNDRIGTAVNVADRFVSSTTAIIAPSADVNLVDALAAAPLAGKTSPILLTDNNTLSDVTKAELIKLKIINVYVVGAISQAVVNQVNAMPGVTATPLKGSDRIGTAAVINSKLTSPAGSFVVGYDALADALSVASYAAANNYSIIVANPDGTLPSAETLASSKVYVIGGPTLVKDIAGATRLAGPDRFATNKVVIDTLGYNYNKIYVANGTDAHLIDSLVASSLAASAGAPIVLTDIATGGDATANDICGTKLVDNAEVVALGGDTVVMTTTLAKFYSVLPTRTVSGVNAIDINTKAGTAPVLPTTVMATMSDGTTKRVKVIWASMTESQYASAGTFMVSGTITNTTTNTTVTVIANVTVTVAARVFTNPSSVNACVGGAQTVNLTAKDEHGNPIPNCTIYLKPNLPGLWITQVNGNTITGSVNMGTSSLTSVQTVNTPVPLFNVPNVPAYNSVAVTGITADHLQTTPVVALTTGLDGTVSITMVDGNLTYVANTASTTVTNSYIIDQGAGICSKSLTFYSDLAGTQYFGSVQLNWAGY